VANHFEEYARNREHEKLATELHELLPSTFQTHVHKIQGLEDMKETMTYYASNVLKGKVMLRFHEIEQ